MKDVIYDIVSSALVLSLTVMLTIPAFRSGMDVLQASATRSNGLEKLYPSGRPEAVPGEVTGSDVIAVIRYYEGSTGMEVEVRNGSVCRSFNGTGYDEDVFYISYEALFDVRYEYAGAKLIKAVYTKKGG